MSGKTVTRADLCEAVYQNVKQAVGDFLEHKLNECGGFDYGDVQGAADTSTFLAHEAADPPPLS